MTIQIGDILRMLAPIAGKEKYHLCIKVADDNGAARFLFMNSNPDFRDTYSVECERVPCLPPSKTGYTAFSFSMLPVCNQEQLDLYGATKLGEISLEIASELREFVDGVQSLTRNEKAIVTSALDELIFKLQE